MAIYAKNLIQTINPIKTINPISNTTKYIIDISFFCCLVPLIIVFQGKYAMPLLYKLRD